MHSTYFAYYAYEYACVHNAYSPDLKSKFSPKEKRALQLQNSIGYSTIVVRPLTILLAFHLFSPLIQLSQY